MYNMYIALIIGVSACHTECSKPFICFCVGSKGVLLGLDFRSDRYVYIHIYISI